VWTDYQDAAHGDGRQSGIISGAPPARVSWAVAGG
jgi:hypothetical protein